MPDMMISLPSRSAFDQVEAGMSGTASHTMRSTGSIAAGSVMPRRST